MHVKPELCVKNELNGCSTVELERNITFLNSVLDKIQLANR